MTAALILPDGTAGITDASTTLNEEIPLTRRRASTTAPMRECVAGEFMPGERVQTDEDWLAYCREMGETVFHPTSTCSMGAVVDQQLRVKGVYGLRVVDASVMPAVPSGNINAAVIALAEKAADLIRAQ